jgi:hypothetical protein
MLRSALLAAFLVAAGASALAQEAGVDVDFTLRPTEAQSGDLLDVFPGSLEDGEEPEQRPPASPPLAGPTGAEVIGPPLAGPTGDDVIGAPLAGPSEAAPLAREAPLRQPRREAEAEPFAATGVALGSFVIRPAIEIGVNATDNPAGGAEGETAIGFLVAPEFVARSEDSDHEIEVALRGQGIFYSQEEFDEREGEARVRGRYDLTSRTSLEGEGPIRTASTASTTPIRPMPRPSGPPSKASRLKSAGRTVSGGSAWASQAPSIAPSTRMSRLPAATSPRDRSSTTPNTKRECGRATRRAGP